MWEAILIIGIILVVLLIVAAVIGFIMTWTGAVEAEGCQGVVLVGKIRGVYQPVEFGDKASPRREPDATTHSALYRRRGVPR